MSYAELDSLPVPTIEDLWAAIDVLEAQELLRDYEVDTFSQLKPGPRRKRHAEVHKRAYPTKIYRPKTTATVGDLNRKLNKG